MKFKELSTYNEHQIPIGHPAHPLEALIKRELLPKKDKHDIEHEEMLKHWGHSNLKANKLTFRKDEKEEYFVDRFWHIALHFKHWKEIGIREEYVKDFEEKYCLLEEVPLPEREISQDLPEY